MFRKWFRKKRYTSETGHWIDADKLNKAEKTIQELRDRIEKLETKILGLDWHAYVYDEKGNKVKRPCVLSYSLYPKTEVVPLREVVRSIMNHLGLKYEIIEPRKEQGLYE